MLSSGRNKMETLTFLQCDTCKCTYVADDDPKENHTGAENDRARKA